MQRILKIKTGVIKRLAKSVEVDEIELQTEIRRMEKYMAEGADGARIRQQEQVIDECRNIIPDTIRRLKAAVKDVEKLLPRAEDDPLVEKEIIDDAKEKLVAGKAILESRE